jgi:hypothetical protein
MDEYEIADLAMMRRAAANLLREAREWLKACLNMVDGDGLPPNWDGIRDFLKRTE